MTIERQIATLRLHGEACGVANDQRGYVSFTRTWESPLRPDHAAARADLLDHLRKHPN